MAAEKKWSDMHIEQSAAGDAESMVLLAQAVYWKYDSIGGVKGTKGAFKLLEAAGSMGDGKVNSKIGDFFRYEFQDNKADEFYNQALIKNLQKARENDAEAQFALSRQYAFGRGVEQNDEKACFWCMMAARNGCEEAQRMMVNFWQDGGTLPMNEEMARAYLAQAGKPMQHRENAEAQELEKALLERECAAVLVEAEAVRDRVKKPRKYRVIDRSKTPFGQVLNFLLSTIASVALAGFVLYCVAAVIVYILNFFVGFHESGFWNFINRSLWTLLGMPLRFVLHRLLGMQDITIQQLCSLYSLKQGLISGVVGFALGAVGSLVWLGIVAAAGSVVALVFSALMRTGLNVKPLRDGSRKKNRKAAGDLEAAQSNLKKLLASSTELQGYGSAALLAICDLMSRRGLSLSSASRSYRSMKGAWQYTRLPIELKKDAEAYSSMAAYFLLRRELKINYAKMPRLNFAPDSNFMKGYRLYRRGKNYLSAEKKLEAARDSHDASERAWANWILASMCRNEFQLPEDRVYSHERKKQNERNINRAEWMQKAAQKNCIKAAPAEESTAALLWNFDADVLEAFAVRLAKSKSEIGKYFAAMAERERENMYACGNPMNHEKWQDFDTECIWAVYLSGRRKMKEISVQHSEIFHSRGEKAAYQYELSALTSLESRLDKVKGKGHVAADDLYESVRSMKGTADFVVHQEEIEREQERKQREMVRQWQREQREEAVNQQLQAFDEKWENMERRRNDWLTGHYETDWDAQTSGRMSQKEYYRRDYAHHEAREKLRKEAESEYDRRKSVEDDD